MNLLYNLVNLRLNTEKRNKLGWSILQLFNFSATYLFLALHALLRNSQSTAQKIYRASFAGMLNLFVWFNILHLLSYNNPAKSNDSSTTLSLFETRNVILYIEFPLSPFLAILSTTISAYSSGGISSTSLPAKLL